MVPPKEMILRTLVDESVFASEVVIAWPALKAISRLGPDTIPDVSCYLPAASDPSFPEQALGLHILMDQCTRSLFQGIDGRWLHWFDKGVRKLFQFFLDLPEEQQPWRSERWPRASFDFLVLMRWTFISAVTHHEAIADQEISLQMVEELRTVVEKHAGVHDPWRDADEESKNDIYAFPRIFANFDLDRDWLLHEAFFFFFMIMDVHKPLIAKYGRYPYRNAIEGRESTEAELEWIEKTNHFAEAPPDIARRVKEDVLAGRWTPLGE
jgi:uncharacterized protein (DUF924 family)